jgi:translation initiation factor IF-3
MPTSKALEIARGKEVDLVEISPKADPPVCKIIDYGKMLYALKKKEQQTKKATKAPELKGIRLTFRMDSGDVERQKKHAEKFLSEGHSIRIQLVMRGREKAHRDLALEKLHTFVDSLSDVARLENKPKLSGHQIVAILKPSKSSK